MAREEELKKDGWERRGIYDESRLVEMMREYAALGFEVRVEPTTKEEVAACGECFKPSGGHTHAHSHDHEHGHCHTHGHAHDHHHDEDEIQAMTLYTRKKP